MKIFGLRANVVVAIALGALTSYIAWRYVDAASQQNNQPVDMAPVVVATQPISARTIITPELVRVQQLPAAAVHPQAAHSANEVIGKVVKSDVVADEQVQLSRLFLQRGESGLAFMIPEGMRAISVGFSEMIGTGGMVTPGDHVDVIGVFEAKGPITTTGQTPASASQTAEPKSDINSSVATIVLQNVQVLAVAQRLEGEDTTKKDQGMSVPGSQPQTPPQQVRSEPAPQPGAKTATLALSPEDALKMVLAEGKGQIRLALRPANDKKLLQSVPQVPVTALLAPAPTTASAAASSR